MNNRDQPAAPVPENLEGYYEDPKTCKRFMPFMGLTKREYFAGLALQGIAADPDFSGDAEDAASIACDYADELLAQLENTK